MQIKLSAALILLSVVFLLSSCVTKPQEIPEDPRLGLLQTQVDDLQTSLSDRDATIADLSAQIAALQADVDKYQPFEAQVADLQKAATAKDATIATLTAGDQRMQAVLDADKRLQTQLIDLRSQIALRDKQIADLQNQIKTKNAQLTKMNELGKQNVLYAAQIKELNKQIGNLTELSQKDAKELDARVAEISKIFAPEIAKGDISIKRYRNVLVIDIKDSILFSPDSPNLLPQNLGILKSLAEVFKRVPERIVRVEGNTAVAISSPEVLKLYPTSWHLGAARSANVVQYLQEKGGVDPRQLVVSSLGEYNPTADNSTEAGKSQNRRVEFVLTAKELWKVDQLQAIAPTK